VIWKRPLALSLPRSLEVGLADLRYALQPRTLLPGNRITLLRDGAEAYPAMLEAIAGAEREIHFESYIFHSDKTGRRFGEAFKERARAGVTVRLLVDAVGSIDLEPAFIRELVEAGVRVATFRPFSWKAGLGFNRRDHRKIVVVDGRVGFTGGLNIGDEYAPVAEGGGGWHDIHARIEGPAVGEMARLFRRTWIAAGGDAYPTIIEEDAHESVATENTAFALAIGNEERRRRATIRRFYLHAMRRARESIHIMNAYFIPDRGIRRVMANAVRRGVKVSVIVPERSDLKSVMFAGQHVFGSLLRAGVRVFQWPDRMLHAKAAVIDSVWATIGSYNLDARSLFHNLEVTLCIVDRAFASGVRAQLEYDAAQSHEVELETWKKRAWWRKVVEWFFFQFRHWL
jgi:cardiolipin synthase A/B